MAAYINVISKRTQEVVKRVKASKMTPEQVDAKIDSLYAVYGEHYVYEWIL